MKRTWIGALALCLAVSGAACSKKNSDAPTSDQKPATRPETTPQQPQTAPEPQQASLTYTKVCEASIDNRDCAGRFGFTIFADGSYQVGPGPAGETRKGKVDAEELQSVSKAFTTTELFELHDLQAPTCHADVWNGQIGYDAKITLTQEGHVKTLANSKDQSAICFAPGAFKDIESAMNFEDALYKLTDKYAADFPNPALETANQLEQLYPALLSCQADADCAYINENFEVAQANEFVGCGAVKQLMVANAKKVAESRTKLVSLRDQAIANGAVTSCSDNGFTVQADKPAQCDQQAKICKAHPEAALY